MFIYLSVITGVLRRTSASIYLSVSTWPCSLTCTCLLTCASLYLFADMYLRLPAHSCALLDDTCVHLPAVYARRPPLVSSASVLGSLLVPYVLRSHPVLACLIFAACSLVCAPCLPACSHLCVACLPLRTSCLLACSRPPVWASSLYLYIYVLNTLYSYMQAALISVDYHPQNV